MSDVSATAFALPTTLDFPLPAHRGGGELRVRASTHADAVFERFHGAYDRAFVLADEKEDRAGFVECLALNHGDAAAALAARYGPFREWVLVLERDGALVGGANLLCHLHTDAAGRALGVDQNLNYAFVDAGHRGHGHLHDLVAAVRAVARRSFPDALAGADPVPDRVFMEINDPLRVSDADYAADTAATGLDQFDRVAIWARLGARILDFPYVQPALSAGQAPARDLLMAVLGVTGDDLDACLLQHHLERFFGISVLKGGDPGTNAEAAAQLRACAADCANGRRFALLDPLPRLAQLRAGRGRQGADPARGLRERLRAAEP